MFQSLRKSAFAGIAKRQMSLACNQKKGDPFLHTDTLSIKIVTTKDRIMIHPISRYIMDWEISDQNGIKNTYTEKLRRFTKTQVYHDYDTESLMISSVPEEILKGLTPSDGSRVRPIVVNIDLWLIPPSVLAMLMKRDSNLVTFRQVKVILNSIV